MVKKNALSPLQEPLVFHQEDTALASIDITPQQALAYPLAC
jgi:hypothetical protein